MMRLSLTLSGHALEARKITDPVELEIIVIVLTGEEQWTLKLAAGTAVGVVLS